jgi:hypothetical protein
MVHNVGNFAPTSDEKLKVRNGDTFVCNCCLKKGFNSWKYEGKQWFFLVSEKMFANDSSNWVLKTNVDSIPYLDFNPSRR